MKIAASGDSRRLADSTERTPLAPVRYRPGQPSTAVRYRKRTIGERDVEVPRCRSWTPGTTWNGQPPEDIVGTPEFGQMFLPWFIFSYVPDLFADTPDDEDDGDETLEAAECSDWPEALIQSLIKKGVVDARVADYGHVIVDESRDRSRRRTPETDRRLEFQVSCLQAGASIRRRQTSRSPCRWRAAWRSS